MQFNNSDSSNISVIVKMWNLSTESCHKVSSALLKFITKSFCGEVTRFCHLSVFVVAINKGKMIKQLDIKQHLLMQKEGNKENFNFIRHKIRKQKAVGLASKQKNEFLLFTQATDAESWWRLKNNWAASKNDFESITKTSSKTCLIASWFWIRHWKHETGRSHLSTDDN